MDVQHIVVEYALCWPGAEQPMADMADMPGMAHAPDTTDAPGMAA